MAGKRVTINDPNTLHDNEPNEISAVTEKVTPVNADLIIIEDSADANNKKKIQIGNIPNQGQSWSLTGNSGLNSAINFLGNTDAIDLVIKTNDVERAKFLSTGEMEITAIADYVAVIIKGFLNQTSDHFQIKNSTGSVLFVIDKDGEIGIKKAVPTEFIDAEESIVDMAGVFRLKHTATSGLSSNAAINLVTGGPNGGDPYIGFAISGAANDWSAGIDNSDSDAFKITESINPSAGNARIKIDVGGKTFINRNLEVGSTQTQDEVQLQILAGTIQTVNILQVGENSGGDPDKFFVIDKTGKVGIGIDAPETALQVKANTPGTVGDNPGGQIIIQGLGTSINTNAVITGYNSNVSGNPNNQLWYLGSSSSSNQNITLINRIAASLSLGTNGISRLVISSAGNITNNNFTKLGSVAPLIKMAKLTGTGGTAENWITNVAHGLGDISKIISATVLLTAPNGNLIPPFFTDVPEFEYEYFITSTNITVSASATNSGSILSSSPFVILLTLEE